MDTKITNLFQLLFWNLIWWFNSGRPLVGPSTFPQITTHFISTSCILTTGLSSKEVFLTFLTHFFPEILVPCLMPTIFVSILGAIWSETFRTREKCWENRNNDEWWKCMKCEWVRKWKKMIILNMKRFNLSLIKKWNNTRFLKLVDLRDKFSTQLLSCHLSVNCYIFSTTHRLRTLNFSNCITSPSWFLIDTWSKVIILYSTSFLIKWCRIQYVYYDYAKLDYSIVTSSLIVTYSQLRTNLRHYSTFQIASI